MAICNALLEKSSNSVLKTGSISAVAAQFSCSPNTVSRIWNRSQESISARSVVADVSSHKKGNSGRKRRNTDEIQQSVRTTPLRSRVNIRSLSASSGIRRSTLQDAKLEGGSDSSQ